MKKIFFIILCIFFVNNILGAFNPVCTITKVRGKRVELKVPGELFWKFRPYSVMNASGSVVGKIKFKSFFGELAKAEIVDGRNLVRKGFTVSMEEHEHPAYYIVLGKIAQKQKKYRNMLVYYKKALACLPKEENPGGMYALIAEAEFLNGNSQNAISTINDAFVQDPNNQETQRVKRLIESGSSTGYASSQGNKYNSNPQSVKTKAKPKKKPEITEKIQTKPVVSYAKTIYTELSKNPSKSFSEIFQGNNNTYTVPKENINKKSPNPAGIGDFLNGKF